MPEGEGTHFISVTDRYPSPNISIRKSFGIRRNYWLTKRLEQSVFDRYHVRNLSKLSRLYI